MKVVSSVWNGGIAGIKRMVFAREKEKNKLYYLRKEPHEAVIPEIIKTDGSVIPERRYMTDDRAIYKHREFSRFFRGSFSGIDDKYQGMKVYRCKTLKRITKLQKETFDYCGELFDVYDENGIINLK